MSEPTALDETATDDESVAVDPPSPALAEFARRTRRANRIYAVAVAAIVLLAAGLFVAAQETGGYEATTIVTTSGDLPVPALQSMAASLSVSWRSSDKAAQGLASWFGTVVTHDDHTVRGRDWRTGEVRWSYSRSDRTVCSVGVQDGAAVAVYRQGADCDEVSGIDAKSGAQRWTRTLVDKGRTTMQINGSAIVLIGTDMVHAFDPSSGIDRWVWNPDGCTFRGVRAGDSGVLASLRCKVASPLITGTGVASPSPTSPDAAKTVSSEPGRNLNRQQDRLVLHRLYEGTDAWQRESSALPVQADRAAIVFDQTTNELRQYDSGNGSDQGSVVLNGATALSGGLSVPYGLSDSSSRLFLYTGARVVGLSSSPTLSLLWSVASTGPAIMLPATADESVPRPVAVPVTQGVQDVDAATGALGTLHASPVTLGLPAYSVRLGTGLVVGNTDSGGAGTVTLK